MSIIRRLTAPYERRALTTRNLAYCLWRFVGNRERARMQRRSRLEHPEAREIARELLDQGIVIAPSPRFLTEAGLAALADASAKIIHQTRSPEVQAIVAGLGPTAGKKSFLVDLVRPQGRLSPDHPLLRVALDVKLLETVAMYLGMWPCLHSVAGWLNYPVDTPAQTSQLWHRDPEDLRIIKVFIYLEDVGDEQGPFTYIPETQPFGAGARRARECQAKRVDDARMQRFFPPEQWRTCAGPAGTMIVADTVGFHRGGKPTVGTRLLVTFTYTSGTPFVEHPLGVTAMPPWISTPIQRYAIEPAVQNYASSDRARQQKMPVSP
jgi:hypothetical protein